MCIRDRYRLAHIISHGIDDAVIRRTIELTPVSYTHLYPQKSDKKVVCKKLKRYFCRKVAEL